VGQQSSNVDAGSSAFDADSTSNVGTTAVLDPSLDAGAPNVVDPPAAPQPSDDGEERPEGPSLRRQFLIASTLGSLLGLGLFAAMVSRGFASFTTTSFGSNFYDVQARSLLAGHYWVPQAIPSIEGIRSHGHTYIYFGPFLSYLRMPLLWAFPGVTGHTSQLSMLLGATVLVIATSVLIWLVRVLARGREPMVLGEQIGLGLFLAGICAGSVIFYLAGSPTVYFETELWGASLAVVAIAFFIRYVTKASVGAAVGLIVATLCDALTRQSVAIGPMVLVGFAVLVTVVRLAVVPVRRRRTTHVAAPPGGAWPDQFARLVLLILGVCVVVGLPAWINVIKFHAPFSVPWTHQEIALIKPSVRHFFHHHGAVDFSNLSSTLSAYLRPIGLAVSGLAPYFGVTTAVSVSGASHFLGVAPTASIPSTMPWLSVLSLIGLAVVIWPRLARWSLGRTGSWALRLAALGALCGGLVVLVFDTIANRYLADELPLLVVLSAVGLVALFTRWPSWPLLVRVLAGVLGVILIAFSCVVNLSLGLQQGVVLSSSSTSESRAGLLSWQLALSRALPFSSPINATMGAHPPTHPSPGELYVQPGCAGVYEWGTASWAMVELGARGGRRVLSIQLPHHRTTVQEALLVGGSPTGYKPFEIFTIRYTPTGRYRLLYLSEPWNNYVGKHLYAETPWYQAPPDRRLVVDLAISSAAPRGAAVARAIIPGVLSFYPGYPVQQTDELSVGSFPGGHFGFSGPLVNEPVPTPLCHQVIGAMSAQARGSLR
jgi:hypothetical protein